MELNSVGITIYPIQEQIQPSKIMDLQIQLVELFFSLKMGGLLK